MISELIVDWWPTSNLCMFLVNISSKESSDKDRFWAGKHCDVASGSDRNIHDLVWRMRQE